MDPDASFAIILIVHAIMYSRVSGIFSDDPMAQGENGGWFVVRRGSPSFVLGALFVVGASFERGSRGSSSSSSVTRLISTVVLFNAAAISSSSSEEESSQPFGSSLE